MKKSAPKRNIKVVDRQCFAALVASDPSTQHTSLQDTAQLMHIVHFLVCCVNSTADLLMLKISQHWNEEQSLSYVWTILAVHNVCNTYQCGVSSVCTVRSVSIVCVELCM